MGREDNDKTEANGSQVFYKSYRSWQLVFYRDSGTYSTADGQIIW